MPPRPGVIDLLLRQPSRARKAPGGSVNSGLRHGMPGRHCRSRRARSCDSTSLRRGPGRAPPCRRSGSPGGGILALFVTGLPFSVSAAIGFISLFGVSVMNGILVLTFFNQLRAQGFGPVDAMERAAEKRMRPMLMTALSACIGLVPAAFSTGIGSQVQRPLATVVVGGMLLGPIMLLAVVPALQLVFLRKEANNNGAKLESEAG
jgi:hypothetical protein